MAKKGKKSFTINLDDVEGRILVPEGEYHVKITSGETKEGEAAPYISWKFTIKDEDKKLNGQSLYYNNSLSPQSLWNLKNLMLSCGAEIPAGDVDPDEIIEAMVDCEFMATVEHENYEGKARARVTDFTPLTGEQESIEVEDEEEEATKKPAAKANGKKAAAVEEEDDEEEDEEEEEEKLSESEVKEMDEDELSALVKKHKLKIDLSKFPRASKKVAAVLDALESRELLA